MDTEKTAGTAPVLRRIGERLALLTGATGIPAVWKAGTGLRVVNGLPEPHRQHTCAFCRAAKDALPDGHARCIRNDEIIIAATASQRRTPFLHRCHMQTEELVIPIFHGDSYLATILLGPFRPTETVAPHPAITAEFAVLPEPDPDRLRALTQLAEMLFSDLIPELSAQTAACLLPDTVRPGERVAAAVEYLRRNFRRRPQVLHAARKCHLSLSHFQHVFKQETGFAFREYLQRLRLVEAERLLTGTTLSPAEIAVVCGLGDQSRLGLLFRRYFQLTPGVYRRRFRSRE